MKQELSSLELHHVVAELQVLVGGRIDKIYQPEKDELLLQIYKQGQGKRVLRVLPGRFIYLASGKQDSPQKPFGYAIFLRKHLNGANVQAISQVGSERIVKIIFETRRQGKETAFHFYIELFGKGNAILCDQKDVILSPLETQEWKDRIVRAKTPYLFPKQKADWRTIDASGLAALLASSSQDSLVKTLASDLGFGGAYAEEACLLSGVAKDKKPGILSPAERAKVFDAVKALRSHEAEPCVVDDAADILPFPLGRYGGMPLKAFATYNEALDSVLTAHTAEAKRAEKRKEGGKARSKAQAIIDAQTKQLERMEKEAAECQRAGELIYEHYHLVEEILRELKAARERHSWKEIKEKLKGHALVKDVDEKLGTVTVEL
jgi:predicted ribosome quality control (RQC) complex YloA/Tae2 family protein